MQLTAGYNAMLVVVQFNDAFSHPVNFTVTWVIRQCMDEARTWNWAWEWLEHGTGHGNEARKLGLGM